jgi:hypothetical protein
MFTEKEIDQRKSRGNIVLLLTDNEISIQDIIRYAGSVTENGAVPSFNNYFNQYEDILIKQVHTNNQPFIVFWKQRFFKVCEREKIKVVSQTLKYSSYNVKVTDLVGSRWTIALNIGRIDSVLVL